MKTSLRIAPFAFALALAAAAASPPARAEHPAKPVATSAQALELARHWTADARLAGVKVGEARSVGLVYTVDLAEDDGVGEPVLHANHLVVRKDDGFVALVYPAHDAPALNREHRLGLEGLAGMSGMTGMGGAAQPYRRLSVNTEAEARRNVEDWLQTNGLGGRFRIAEATRVHRIFLVDLDDARPAGGARTPSNQAVVRAVDGYVSLVRALGPTVPSLPNFSAARR